MNDQDEMFEAATETPIGESKSEVEVEQRKLPILPKLPGGFDGTEPLRSARRSDPTVVGRDVPGAPEVTRKHTMDFGRFHVTRAAIPGRTVLTFRRKQEVDEEHGSLVPGRIIIATIVRSNKICKTVCDFDVRSYMPGESSRTLFYGCSEVSMSKTEKIVYKMVKCDTKETQRRHITRKRKRDAAKQEGK